MFRKIFLLFCIILNSFAFAQINYAPHLPVGTLVKVYTKKPINTENLEEGSAVSFVSPSDVWVLEKKVIEKGDVFVGHVNMLKMPVQGVNAAMSIAITNIIKLSGEKIPLNGRIIFFNSDVLGGNLTNPASYNTTIHPRKVYGNHWGGALQYVPSGEYEFGHHVGISSRDSIFVQFDEEYYI